MSQNLQNCPHERRPGTMVCLHCRHAERLAARAARGRMFSHVMLGGAILGVIAVVVSAATAAFDGRQEADAATVPAIATASLASTGAAVPAPAQGEPTAQQTVREVAAANVALVTPPVVVTQPAPSSPVPAASQTTAAVPAPAVARSASPAMPLIPFVPEGTSPLADSMSVVREGDTMLVHFDTELARTRRPEKFDAVVRATLVQIYGPAGENLLSNLAPGTFARGGDLLAELPTRGIRIPAGDGTTLSLWPVTRPGRDGPLVVGYRATVTP